MAKFRKRPVVIDAVQWFEKEHLERQHYQPGSGMSGRFDPLTGVRYKFHNDPSEPPTPIIPTLEGDMIVSDGDWIITGVKNEKYPCKDEIFKLTYEPVDE